MPAFLSSAAIRSRYASGSDSASAIALSETGWRPPCTPSCTSSRTPYSALVVKIIATLKPTNEVGVLPDSVRSDGQDARSLPARRSHRPSLPRRLRAHRRARRGPDGAAGGGGAPRAAGRDRGAPGGVPRRARGGRRGGAVVQGGVGRARRAGGNGHEPAV